MQSIPLQSCQYLVRKRKVQVENITETWQMIDQTFQVQ